MNPKQRSHLSLVPRDAGDAPPLPDAGEHGKDLEQYVYEGEIVEDNPDQAKQPASTELQVRSIGPLMHVQPSPQAVKVARVVTAQAVTVGQGWHSWWTRAWDALTLGVYREQIRVARATGDREALAHWLTLKQDAIAKRRERLLDLPRIGLQVAIFAGGGCLALVVLLVVVALLVWMTGAGDFTDVFSWVGGVLRWLFGAVALLWLPLLAGGLFAFLVVAPWREGRRKRAAAPQWVSAPGEQKGDRRGVFPDESAILQALQHLGISPLNKAFKSGWRPRIVLGTGRDGKGWRTQLELPPGVTVDMINQKKSVLAHNLVRLPVEVWPTEPKSQPGVLDLWVADQGSLTGPVPEWPLLKKGTTDYFAGVPVSIDIRGRSVTGLLNQKNYALAGTMGSGKSTMILTLLLGAILDPLPEIDVFVFATNADYDPLKPRLRTLLTGPGDEVVEACLFLLRDLYADLSVRGQALKDHAVPSVTREVAEKDERLRPRIVVIDECQALFLHEELGEEAEDLCVKLMGAARKYAVTLIFATPEPSSDSLPRKLMAVISNKACFAIGDQTSNDAVLGTGSYKAGISAVSLEPKTEDGPGDIGTCMARGFQGKPGLLRTYYVPYDEMKSVVERAMGIREKAILDGASFGDEKRDLLDDLLEVIGPDPVPAAQALAALKSAYPRHRPYALLRDRLELVRELDLLGVKVPSSKNRHLIDPVTIRGRMAEIAAARTAEEDGAG
ncbi:hypothetical protein ABZ917_17145 [Nonomuraea wenchangensis]